MKLNKWIVGLTAVAIVALASAARAQTNPPLVSTGPEIPVLYSPPAPTNSFTLASLFTGNFGKDVEHVGQDAVSFVEQTGTSNGIVTVEAGALFAEHTKSIGGFLDAYLPVGGTNSIFGAGFGVAYLDHNFYDATLNARVGDEFNLPFIHIPLYAYIESGGGYNLSKSE
ncbi:MAG TPA: hypothetical protein VHX90_01155, partial [Verrucomicrobiae bacterium]|nr:hypothetical protein [Verrucomicrobiae bacterium]